MVTKQMKCFYNKNTSGIIMCRTHDLCCPIVGGTIVIGAVVGAAFIGVAIVKCLIVIGVVVKGTIFEGAVMPLSEALMLHQHSGDAITGEEIAGGE